MTKKCLSILLLILIVISSISLSSVSAETVQPWSAEEIAQMGEWIKEEAAGQPITLKVWQPEVAQTVFKEQCDTFVELFKDYADITIEVAVQGEYDTAVVVIHDPKAAADVFGFPSDQMNQLIDANALMDVYFPEQVTAMNKKEIIDIATQDGKIYAYPETGDNSYVLAYDKSLLTADDVKSFETMLTACKEQGKKFIMDAGNSFFACTFLFTGGLRTEGFEEDGITQKFNDYDIDQITASFKAFTDLFKEYTGTFEANDTTATVDGFKNGTAAAGFAGSWNIAAVKEILGENAGFAVLPTININGTDTTAINMIGYKYIGVNKQSDYPITAQTLAYYLTNEECQIERAEELGWPPTNLNAMESDFVKNDEAMTAFIRQSDNSVPQACIAGMFWISVDELGGYIVNANNSFSTEEVTAQVIRCIQCILDKSCSCNGLENITIPEGTTRINGLEFYACKNLNSIELPDGLTYIGSYAFKGCSGLESITIPASVTNIASNAFDSDLAIYGYTNSYAEKYARAHGMDFVSVGTMPTVPDTKYDLGDVNLDGNVNVKDATAIQKHVASIIILEDTALSVADYDGDEKITVKDATAIQKFVAGIV